MKEFKEINNVNDVEKYSNCVSDLLCTSQLNVFNKLLSNSDYKNRSENKPFYISELVKQVENFIIETDIESDVMYLYKFLVENYYNNDIVKIFIDIENTWKSDNSILYYNWRNYLML